MELAMFKWPEMLRHAEDWADGFWARAASTSLMLVAGTAFVLLVRAILSSMERDRPLRPSKLVEHIGSPSGI
jgi:hypothetical protein